MARPDERPSVATRDAVARPGMPAMSPTIVRGLQDRPDRFSWGISSGTPSSHVVCSRWTPPSARSAQNGAHAVTTARQIGRCPAT